MLSYISGSVDEELLLRNEYLVAENRVLRNRLQGRLRLTDGGCFRHQVLLRRV